jgi:hypothetical protein
LLRINKIFRDFLLIKKMKLKIITFILASALLISNRQYAQCNLHNDSLPQNSLSKTKQELQSLLLKINALGYMPMQTNLLANAQDVSLSKLFREMGGEVSYYSLSNNQFPEIITAQAYLYTNNQGALPLSFFKERACPALSAGGLGGEVFGLSIDPKVQKFPSASPYNAMANDPINRIDMDGKASIMVSAFIFSLMSGDPLVAATGEALTYTDADDIAVLTTRMHVNGEPATTLDYTFATAGTALPLVAGGVIGDIFKWFKGSDDISAVSSAYKKSEEMERVYARFLSHGRFSRKATLLTDQIIRSYTIDDLGRMVHQPAFFSDFVEPLKANSNSLTHEDVVGLNFSGTNSNNNFYKCVTQLIERLNPGDVGILTIQRKDGSCFTNIYRGRDGLYYLPQLDNLDDPGQVFHLHQPNVALQNNGHEITQYLEAQIGSGGAAVTLTITGRLPE